MKVSETTHEVALCSLQSVIQYSIQLRSFSSSPIDAVRTIEVLTERSAAGELKLTFCLRGDIARIRLPPAALPRFATELWQHTCFEAFVGIEGQPAYHEFNFAPSGEWAVYAFSDYRQGRSARAESQPLTSVDVTDARLELKAVLGLGTLSAEHRDGALRIGLSAVIEAVDGTRSYWAIRHPADRPDFHHVGSFALRFGSSNPER
jgi:hypothetical protein